MGLAERPSIRRNCTEYHIINRPMLLLRTSQRRVSAYEPPVHLEPLLSSFFSSSDMSIRPGRFLRQSANSLRTLTLATARPVLHESLPAHSSSSSPAPLSRLTGLSRQFSTSSLNMAPVTKQYDYIVIGGGSGGSGAARRASGWYGAKTCIVDAGVSGGCCVNVGSVERTFHAIRFCADLLLADVSLRK